MEEQTNIKLEEITEFMFGEVDWKEGSGLDENTYTKIRSPPEILNDNRSRPFILLNKQYLPRDNLNDLAKGAELFPNYIVASGIQKDKLFDIRHERLMEAINMACRQQQEQGNRAFYFESGGGYINVNDKRILLNGESEDYGKYDITHAQPIIERMKNEYFPNLELICE